MSDLWGLRDELVSKYGLRYCSYDPPGTGWSDPVVAGYFSDGPQAYVIPPHFVIDHRLCSVLFYPVILVLLCSTRISRTVAHTDPPLFVNAPKVVVCVCVCVSERLSYNASDPVDPPPFVRSETWL
jgi:hypothetical protein